MSIVIVGGNERMEGKYLDICREYGCRAKVFTKEKGSLKKKLGCPDLVILFTGAVSHFAIGGMPNIAVWILCIVFTLLWARIAAVFANKATPKTLNRATGVILVVLGIVVMAFSILN